MELVDAIRRKALLVVAIGTPHLIDVLAEASVELVRYIKVFLDCSPPIGCRSFILDSLKISIDHLLEFL